MRQQNRVRQYEAALARANEVRLERAHLRREIKDGNIELACELLLEGHPAIAEMAIGEFVQWLPGVGPQRANLIMAPAFNWYQLSTPTRKVGGLDLATCLRLAHSIRERLGAQIAA